MMQRKALFSRESTQGLNDQNDQNGQAEDDISPDSNPNSVAETTELPVQHHVVPLVQLSPMNSINSRQAAGPTLVSRIKARLSLVDYLSQQMKLKPQPGQSGELLGNCPDSDHKDSTPSFYVSSKDQIYHCHGCGISGNVIHAYAIFNGLQYLDAKKQLGRDLGVFNERAMDDHESMLLNTARKYIDQLARKDDALDYLISERGLTHETMAKFGIGFCWGRECQDMTPHQKQLAIDTGVLREATDKSPEKSAMAGRITFPIRNRGGRVVGFAGRLVPSEFKSFGPKYLNTAETAFFKKSELLYGAYEASAGISKAGYAVVLEGYMDVVTTHQYGVDNTVAVMGAYANDATFATLWSMTKRAVFCLDGDAAGNKGTMKAAFAAAPTMPDGCEIAIAKMPEGVDPAEFVLDHGGDAFKVLCENGTPLSRYLMEQSASNFDLSYPEGRAAFIEEAQHVSSLFVSAPVVRDQIIAEAYALNAAGLASYALGVNNVGDNIEPNLIRDTIAMLQRKLANRPLVLAPIPVAVPVSPTVTAQTGSEPERARQSRRP